MGKGFLAVGIAALAVFVGVHLWANTAEDGWNDDRRAVTRENVDRVGSDEPLDDPPAEPFVSEHRTVVAIGAALVVAVVGSILVLLSVIAANGRRS